MSDAFKQEIKSEGMANNGASSVPPLEFPSESPKVAVKSETKMAPKQEERFKSSGERFSNDNVDAVIKEGDIQPQEEDIDMDEVENYFSTLEDDVEDTKTLQTELKNAYGGDNNIISYNPNNQAATLIQQVNKVYQQSEIGKQEVEKREMIYQDAIMNNTKDLMNMGDQIIQTNNNMVSVNNDLQTTKVNMQNDMLLLQQNMLKQMQEMMEQFTKSFEQKLSIIEGRISTKYDNEDAQRLQAQILNQNKRVDEIVEQKVNQQDLEKIQDNLRSNILDTKDLESKIARVNLHSIKGKDIEPLEKGLDNNTAQIESLNEKTKKYTTNLIKLETKFNKLNQRISSTESELQKSLKKNDNVSNNLDNTIKALTNDCNKRFTELKNESTHFQLLNTTTKNEMDTAITKLQKQIQEFLTNQSKYENTLHNLENKISYYYDENKTKKLEETRSKLNKLEQEYTHVINSFNKIMNQPGTKEYNELIEDLEKLRESVYKQPRIADLQTEYKNIFARNKRCKALFNVDVDGDGRFFLHPRNDTAAAHINALIKEHYLGKVPDLDKSLGEITNPNSFFNNSFAGNSTMERQFSEINKKLSEGEKRSDKRYNVFKEDISKIKHSFNNKIDDIQADISKIKKEEFETEASSSSDEIIQNSDKDEWETVNSDDELPFIPPSSSKIRPLPWLKPSSESKPQKPTYKPLVIPGCSSSHLHQEKQENYKFNKYFKDKKDEEDYFERFFNRKNKQNENLLDYKKRIKELMDEVNDEAQLDERAFVYNRYSKNKRTYDPNKMCVVPFRPDDFRDRQAVEITQLESFRKLFNRGPPKYTTKDKGYDYLRDLHSYLQAYFPQIQEEQAKEAILYGCPQEINKWYDTTFKNHFDIDENWGESITWNKLNNFIYFFEQEFCERSIEEQE